MAKPKVTVTTRRRRLKTKQFWLTAAEFWKLAGDSAFIRDVRADMDRRGWKIRGRVTLTYFSDGSGEARLPLRDGPTSATRVISWEGDLG